MAKHARIKRLRLEAEIAKLAGEEKPRGPITEKQAAERAREFRSMGLGRGTFAFGTRVRRDIKQHSVFKDKAPKKRREDKIGRKKRGRR